MDRAVQSARTGAARDVRKVGLPYVETVDRGESSRRRSGTSRSSASSWSRSPASSTGRPGRSSSRSCSRSAPRWRSRSGPRKVPRLRLHRRLGARAAHDAGHDARDARLPPLALRRPARRDVPSRTTRSSRCEQAPAGHRLHASPPPLGFAALAVSKIRPIREMGLWTAVGLALPGWSRFTLFPALQKALRTPTEHERPRRATRLYDAVRRTAAALHVPLALAARPRVALLCGRGRRRALRLARTSSRRCARRGRARLRRPAPRDPPGHDLASARARRPASRWPRVWVRTAPGAGPRARRCSGVSTASRPRRRGSAASSLGGGADHVAPHGLADLAGDGDRLPTTPQGFARPRRPDAAILRRDPSSRASSTPRPSRTPSSRSSPRGGDGGGTRRSPAPCTRPGPGGRGGSRASRASTLQVVGEAMLQAKVAGEPRPDAHRELRPDRGDHLRRVPGRVPQRHGAADGDDPLALRILVMFGDAPLRHVAQRGDDPDRLDGPRHLRERPDPLLLPLPGGARARRAAAGRCATRCWSRAAPSSSRR